MFVVNSRAGNFLFKAFWETKYALAHFLMEL
uniref:Uncharacterized protein n=1 Tax=Rhizophora mucronata TaxID=61149 RepID=A0A2P2M6L6_RHIMU